MVPVTLSEPAPEVPLEFDGGASMKGNAAGASIRLDDLLIGGVGRAGRRMDRVAGIAAGQTLVPVLVLPKEGPGPALLLDIPIEILPPE